MVNDLNALAYFAAVADHGGFAAAERATGTPKSKLSRRIALLEERLGVRLIQRSTRRFALTEIGREYLRHCHAMLAEAESAQALVDAQSAQPRGTVRLACPPALLHSAVGPMLLRFLQQHPQVRLHVEATNRNVDLWNERLDVALRVRFAPLLDHSEAVVKNLAISPHVLAAAPGLLQAMAVHGGAPQSPHDLARWPTLGLGNAPDEERWLLQGPGGAVAEVAHQPRLVANDMGALLAAALAGVGCAPLPLVMAHDALASGALAPLLPDWAPRSGTIQAAFASRRGLLPAVRRLLDHLGDEFALLIAQGKCLQAL